MRSLFLIPSYFFFLFFVFDISAQNIKTESNLMYKINDWSLSCDENLLYTSGPSGVAVWDVDKMLLIKNFPEFSGKSLMAHPTDNDWFYTDGMLVDRRNGKVIAHMSPPKLRFRSAGFAGLLVDGALVMSSDEELVESQTRKSLFESVYYFGNHMKATDERHFADSVITSLGGNPLMLEPSGVVFKRLSDDGDYMIVTPEQYYKVSPGAYAKVHFVNANGPVVSDALELKYNRPDIVMEKLGASPERVSLLNKAWKKRLKRLEVKESSLEMIDVTPTINILNANKLPKSTSDEFIRVNVSFSDLTASLKEIHLTVNGVTLPRSYNDSLAANKYMRYQVSDSIPLAYGKNIIEYTVTNSKGITSPKRSFSISCVKPKMHRNLYVVTIGVGAYNDSTYNLVYPQKDAADFASLFPVMTADFKQIKVKDFRNGFRKESLNEIIDFLSSATIDDVVIIFYAGHGVLDEELDYYLATSDMDFSSPGARGIGFDEFISSLYNVKAMKRYVIIDACHSGSIDKDDIAERTISVSASGNGAIPYVKFRSISSLKLAAAEVEKVNTLFANEFSNGNARHGATIVSSASGTETAVEGDIWENGLFTYCLKEGVQKSESTGKLIADSDANGRLTMTEWLNYARKRVKQLSNGAQIPTLRTLNRQEETEIDKSYVIL